MHNDNTSKNYINYQFKIIQPFNNNNITIIIIIVVVIMIIIIMIVITHTKTIIILISMLINSLENRANIESSGGQGQVQLSTINSDRGTHGNR